MNPVFVAREILYTVCIVSRVTRDFSYYLNFCSGRTSDRATRNIRVMEQLSRACVFELRDAYELKGTNIYIRFTRGIQHGYSFL